MAKVEGRSEKTLDLYDYVFDRLSEQINEEVEASDIDSTDIGEYLAFLMDEGLKNTSIAIHHRVLKAFFNWLVDEGALSESPMKSINPPKTPHKFPKVLDEKQLDRYATSHR